MTSRIVLSSRHFQRDYLKFLNKYSGLETNFDNFLKFRATARPDQPFNSHDCRITDTKFRRCHLIHGKAILIYHLHGSEIRLIALDEHAAVESGSSKMVLNYAKSLRPEDYYRFDINTAQPSKDIVMPVLKIEPPILTTPEIATPIEPPLEIASDNPLWSDKVVEHLRGQQMLWVPRPANQVIVLRLEKEILASKGDAIVIDLVTLKIHHLTPTELEACFQPAPQSATTLEEAIPLTMPTTPMSPVRSVPHRSEGIGAQTGRVLLTIANLHARLHTTKFDARTIRDNVPQCDRMSLSAVLSKSLKQGLIRKVGGIKGTRAFYYALTPRGDKTIRKIGDWPFTSIGLTQNYPAIAAE